MPNVPNDIILFGYPTSPYFQRVAAFLTLRGIHYAECLQPRILPRPDLQALGINYRRIPVLYFRGTVYCDSRLILRVLSEAFPLDASSNSPDPISSLSPSHLSSKPPSAPHRALAPLLSHLATDVSTFRAVVGAFPPTGPVFKDDAFLRDRENLLYGVDLKRPDVKRVWTAESQAAGQAEALTKLRSIFELVETGLLVQEGGWVSGEEKPGMADLEAVWPLQWAIAFPGLLPPSLISANQFPKTFAWVSRFNALLAAAQASNPKPVPISGDEAVEYILSKTSGAGRSHAEDVVDSHDAFGLKEGEEVVMYPTDYGGSFKDSGRLVRLDKHVVVIEVEAGSAGGGKVRVAVPRWGFKVARMTGESGAATRL